MLFITFFSLVDRSPIPNMCINMLCHLFFKLTRIVVPPNPRTYRGGLGEESGATSRNKVFSNVWKDDLLWGVETFSSCSFISSGNFDISFVSIIFDVVMATAKGYLIIVNLFCYDLRERKPKGVQPPPPHHHHHHPFYRGGESVSLYVQEPLTNRTLFKPVFKLFWETIFNLFFKTNIIRLQQP